MIWSYELLWNYFWLIKVLLVSWVIVVVRLLIFFFVFIGFWLRWVWSMVLKFVLMVKLFILGCGFLLFLGFLFGCGWCVGMWRVEEVVVFMNLRMKLRLIECNVVYCFSYLVIYVFLFDWFIFGFVSLLFYFLLDYIMDMEYLFCLYYSMLFVVMWLLSFLFGWEGFDMFLDNDFDGLLCIIRYWYYCKFCICYVGYLL